MAAREDATAPAIQALTAQLASPAAGDPEARRQLAQIERLLQRLGDGVIGGQSALTQELRSELRLLARTLTGRPDTPRES